jgi:hypothetical protein
LGGIGLATQGAGSENTASYMAYLFLLRNGPDGEKAKKSTTDKN